MIYIYIYIYIYIMLMISLTTCLFNSFVRFDNCACFSYWKFVFMNASALINMLWKSFTSSISTPSWLKVPLESPKLHTVAGYGKIHTVVAMPPKIPSQVINQRLMTDFDRDSAMAKCMVMTGAQKRSTRACLRHYWEKNPDPRRLHKANPWAILKMVHT